VGSHWAAWKWAPGFVVGPGQEHNIGWAEAVAIELGLQAALHWGIVQEHVLAQNVFVARSDNAGVVAVLTKGRSRSRETNKVLKRIYLTLAQKGMRLEAEHTLGKQNISDCLSQGDISGFQGAFPNIT
jgi:hypothetical protein